MKTEQIPTFEDIRKMQAETARQMQETDRRMKETDRRLKKLDELFNGHWGKLMESLVKGDLLKLLKERGIEVQRIAREHEGSFGEENYEVDIIAVNGQEVVVVEVKTTLRLENVNDFIKKLGFFKKWFQEYADRKVYGAVAYLKANEGSSQRAMKEGLFVIRAAGSSASIVNKQNFKPKVF